MGQRMQSKHLLIGAAIAALLAAASTSAVAESAAERQLIEQGQYWQQRDSARATQAWNKLLLARPGSADALLGLGQLARKDCIDPSSDDAHGVCNISACSIRVTQNA